MPPIPTPVPPALRHVEFKALMLDLINLERQRVSLEPLDLGTNGAAQLHAESAIRQCFSSHWGVDGLKPYMRYSLAGGYQSNSENGHGLDYCITPSDRIRAITSIREEVIDAMEGWMDSPGHRLTMLGATHKRVNIGLAWDKYNFAAYQQFEGDYVRLNSLPTIRDGVLSLSGRTRNGVEFKDSDDLGVQVYYDPPPHRLTRGQLTRTYCYDSGRLVASLRRPLTGNRYWIEDEFTKTYKPCPNPYLIPADARGPRSADEAHVFWQAAYIAAQNRIGVPITVPWITASEWEVGPNSFSVKAHLGNPAPGVYTVVVWAPLGSEREVVSEYSIFHNITPPDTYTP